MAWKDELRPASFRGVPFKVDSADSSHGRRQAVHEHAQRDVPQTEDLGRKAREFTVDGLILGKEYFGERDALVDACETAGAGVLVHPYRGELTVVCRGLTVRESAADGGMCRISMTFLEAGEASYPSATVDSVNAISKASNTLTVEAETGFVDRFVTTGFPAFVRDAAAAQLKGIAEFMESPGFNMAGEIDAASEFYLSVRSLATDAYDLVLTPVKLAQRLIGVVTSIRSAFGSFADFLPSSSALSGPGSSATGANSYRVLSKLVGTTQAPYTGLTQTPSRQQQAANHDALNDLVRQVVIGEMSKEAVVTDFDSIQDATKTRTEITDLIDQESERTASDNVYVALGGLHTEVVRGIPPASQSLPQLISYTPRVTLPSLLVAYQVYGDASRADEIALRNKPRHPGFLPGGDPLEVLADG
jgi:prophage DNA circulation protein